MEPDVLNVVCRDGIPARVQLVAYEGAGGGQVFFGWRNVPGLKEHDIDGPDIWNLAGCWYNQKQPHDFDLMIELVEANG